MSYRKPFRYVTREEPPVNRMRPLPPHTQRRAGQQYLVFRDEDKIVLSMVTRTGTASFALAHDLATDIARSLNSALVQSE
jgi:hypothetical protein